MIYLVYDYQKKKKKVQKMILRKQTSFKLRTKIYIQTHAKM